MIRTVFRAVDGVLRGFFDAWVKLTRPLYEPPTGQPEPEIVLIPVEDLKAFVDALSHADERTLTDEDEQAITRAHQALYGDPRWN